MPVLPSLSRSRTLRGLREDVALLRRRGRHGEQSAAAVEPTELDPAAAIADYLATHEVRKLQLGAGGKHHDGWLCTDIEPRRPGVVRLDATRRLPLPDDSLDYVFAEHLIEHLGWKPGQRMLSECLRVLRPGGVIRVATPDLARYIAIYRGDAGEEGDHYLDWAYTRFLKGRPHRSAVFLLNHNMRAWGHTFLYDADLLALALADAGYVDVDRRAFNESPHEALRGIERHGIHGGLSARAVEFETMIFEAAKPLATGADAGRGQAQV